MSSYRYEYRVTPIKVKPIPNVRYVYYPLLQIGLVNNAKGIKTTALVDTGAQYCFFDHSYAPVLGINYKDTKHRCPLTGIGGHLYENVAYFHELNMVIYKPSSYWGSSQKAWEIKTWIGFLEKSTMFSAILGEYGFFDYFKFTCCLPESYFELEHAHE